MELAKTTLQKLQKLASQILPDDETKKLEVEEIQYEEILDETQISVFKEEFYRLKESCYLDHAGATLFAKSQLELCTQELQNNLFSNPHSRNPSSSVTADATDNVRQRILQHFGTNENEYSVVFTSGATASLKLLGESFSFNGGLFAYLEECHTSVMGLREYLIDTSSKYEESNKSEKAFCISKLAFEQILTGHNEKISTTKESCKTRNSSAAWRNALVGYSAQCNFSGYKYPLGWIPLIQNGKLQSITNSREFYIDESSIHGLQSNCVDEGSYNWYVVLDASNYVGSNHLDLHLHKPDFVVLSFYKMFGWPTGLGAFLVRNESAHVLGNKKYFGGGTVNIAVPSKTFHRKRSQLHERFEDGTIDFLSILSLRHGLDTLDRLCGSMDVIGNRTFRLAQYFFRKLKTLKYGNGQHVAVIYSDTDFTTRSTQGPVVTFNLLRPDGHVIGYSEMEQIAYLHDVHLRYGCFCNPGACRRHLNHTAEDVMKHFESGHVCGDMRDLIDGQPTGAIRTSMGYMTTKENVDFLLKLIENCWIQPFNVKLSHSQKLISTSVLQHNNVYDERKWSNMKLRRIFVYPIKSCAAFEVSGTWTLGNHGLLYDREWLIVHSNGVPLTTKREPRLCLIRPNIDISQRKLRLSFDEEYETISVPLDINVMKRTRNVLKTDLCATKVCGDTIMGLDCGDEVAEWLSLVLGRDDLRLIRMSPDHRRKPRKSADEISLANQSQFLLLSAASLRQLATQLISNGLHSTMNIPSTTTTDSQKSITTNNNNGGENLESQESLAIESLIGRFRSNFVVDDETHSNVNPYDEEMWSNVRIAGTDFQSDGPCVRCSTICMDPTSGQKSSEPLLTLSQNRGGRPSFGIHLRLLTPSKIIGHQMTQNDTKLLRVLRIGDPFRVM